MLSDAERDAALDRAVVAAADAVDAATDDQAERDTMWRMLCGGVLIAAIAEADAAGQASMAERLDEVFTSVAQPIEGVALMIRPRAWITSMLPQDNIASAASLIRSQAVRTSK